VGRKLRVVAKLEDGDRGSCKDERERIGHPE
jgi:hypothetical protein